VKLTFQVEKWSDVLPELLPMFGMLWDDVAVDKDRFVAVCDQAKYRACEEAGILHLVTARDEGKLAGYFLMLVTPNPHYYEQGLMALTDMYYLLPQYRMGNNGLKLFSFMEQTVRAIGCVKMYTSHKLHRDRSLMFEALGLTPTDTIYSKVLD
jgi:hypothetical protein